MNNFIITDKFTLHRYMSNELVVMRLQTEEMIGLIREAFGTSVAEADWMLPETRNTASEKVREIVWNVGYPEELLNATHMSTLYGQVRIFLFAHS